MTESKEYSEYKEIIATYAQSGDPRIFSNGSQAHATALIETLFSTAQEKIQLLSGFLNPEVYDVSSVINEAEKFVLRNGKLEILLEGSEPNHSAENVLNQEFLLSLRRRLSKEQLASILLLRKSSASGEHPFHLLVADNKAFRFEPNKRDPKAIASFNNPKLAKQLSRLFEDMRASYSSEGIALDHC